MTHTTKLEFAVQATLTMPITKGSYSRNIDDILEVLREHGTAEILSVKAITCRDHEPEKETTDEGNDQEP